MYSIQRSHSLLVLELYNIVGDTEGFILVRYWSINFIWQNQTSRPRHFNLFSVLFLSLKCKLKCIAHVAFNLAPDKESIRVTVRCCGAWHGFSHGFYVRVIIWRPGRHTRTLFFILLLKYHSSIRFCEQQIIYVGGYFQTIFYNHLANCTCKDEYFYSIFSYSFSFFCFFFFIKLWKFVEENFAVELLQ